MYTKSVHLGEIARVIAGQSPPGASYNDCGLGLPFFQGKADFGDIYPVARKWCTDARKIAEAGDILISVRAPVGPTNIAREKCCIGRGLAAVRPDASVALPEFVHWMLIYREKHLINKAQGSTFSAIGMNDLKSIIIPLPYMDQQHRIVKLMNRSRNIEILHRQSLHGFDTLLPSLFAKLFGESNDSPTRYGMADLNEVATAPLGELCDVDRRAAQPNDPTVASLPFVGMENVESDTGRLDLAAGSRIGNRKSAAFRFDERHVLYAKLRPYLNKVATPDFTGICSTELVPLRPRSGVDRYFLANVLRRRSTVEFATASSTGARMPRTDMNALMSMPAPFPPPAEQRRFGDVLVSMERTARKIDAASQKAAALRESLMAKLFGDDAGS